MMTILGGQWVGLSPVAAAEFSFFLAIPTLIGAGVYSLYKERALLSLADVPMFAVGFVFSLLPPFVRVAYGAFQRSGFWVAGESLYR